MSNDTGSAIARALLIWVLIFATLGFGLAGLCGATVTVMSLPGIFRWLTSGDWTGFFTTPVPGVGLRMGPGALLEISVPSLLIGCGVAWWCGRKLWKWWRE